MLNTLKQNNNNIQQQQGLLDQQMAESLYNQKQQSIRNSIQSQQQFPQQQQQQLRQQQTYNPQQNSNINLQQDQQNIRNAQTLTNEHEKLVGLNIQRRIQSKINRNRESIDIMRESFGINKIFEQQKQQQQQQRNTLNNSIMSSQKSNIQAIGQPMQLIKCDGDKFLMNQTALKMLNQSKCKVGFVSIIGKYRTGKSFLMNKILQNPPGNGFQVDSSVKSQTKGIWMWSKPIYCGNQDMNLYFIDTEGTGSVDQEKQHRDGQITALSILLSSYVIFNSVGCIDEQSIGELSYITQISRLITQNYEQEGNRSSLPRQSQIGSQQDDLIKQYDWPHFLWLLRDFTLEITDQMGNPISSSEYLEKCLVEQKPISDNPQSQQSQQQFVLNKKVRQIITKVFKHRDCITIVRPIENEQDLQNLENIPFDQYRQQFQKDLIFLREKILEEAQPKRINGVPLTPSMFCSMISNYVQTINQSGFLPNINTTWESIIQQECEMALKKSQNHYNKLFAEQFSGEFVFSIKDLNSILNRIKQESYVIFEENAQIKDKNIFFSDFRQKLMKYIQQNEENVYYINEQYCKNYNLNLFDKLMNTIKINTNKDIYQLQNVDQFSSELNQAVQEYNKNCINLNELDPFVEFFSQEFPKILINIQQNSKTQLEKGQEFMEQKKKIFGDIEDGYKVNMKMLEEKLKIEEDRKEKLQKENELLKKRDLQQQEILVAKDQLIEELEQELVKVHEKNEVKQRELTSVKEIYRKKQIEEKKGCCQIF